MYRSVAIFPLLLVAAAPSPVQAGKDATEEVLTQMLGQLEKMADTLATVKDEDSALAAKGELRKNVAVYLELRAKAQKLPPPSREVKDRLEKEYKKKFVAVQERLVLEMTRIRSAVPGGREALADVSALILGKDTKSKEKEKSKEKD